MTDRLFAYLCDVVREADACLRYAVLALCAVAVVAGLVEAMCGVGVMR